MLHFSTWKTATVLIVLLVGTVLAIPSLMPRATLEQMPGWFPKQTVSLGLDLQGGSHLLLEVDMQSLIRERLAGVLDETRASLRKANIGYTNLAVKGDKVTLNLRDAGSVETAQEQLRSLVIEGMELAVDGTQLTIGFTEVGRLPFEPACVGALPPVGRMHDNQRGSGLLGEGRRALDLLDRASGHGTPSWCADPSGRGVARPVGDFVRSRRRRVKGLDARC